MNLAFLLRYYVHTRSLFFAKWHNFFIPELRNVQVGEHARFQ